MIYARLLSLALIPLAGIIMTGGNGSSSSAMDAVGLNMMMEVVKKMNTK